MKLQVLPNEQFSCQSCTDCCRHQMVELFTGEPEKLDRLQWPADDPLATVKGYMRRGGKTYMNRREDGACVFLNLSNGLCRIHEQFGPEYKCVACRIFPFQITPTFAGEASVTARFGCPTVRKNEGAPHSASLPLLRQYTDRWVPTEGFDEAQRCHLHRDQIEAVAEFLSTLLNAFPSSAERALFVPFLASVLATTAADQLDRAALAGVFLPLKEQIAIAVRDATNRPGLLHRAAFRTLLALHLRRDEDVIDGKATRFGRLWAMTAFVFGFGSFTQLGIHHPPGGLRKAGLFKTAPQVSVDTYALLWRLMRNKLDGLQFFGPANGGRDLLSGLRSLSLLYPLTVAAAKQSAASRGSASVEAIDVDYGVAAIEHSFGRQKALALPFARRLESVLTDSAVIARLVCTI